MGVIRGFQNILSNSAVFGTVFGLLRKFYLGRSLSLMTFLLISYRLYRYHSGISLIRPFHTVLDEIGFVLSVIEDVPDAGVVGGAPARGATRR